MRMEDVEKVVVKAVESPQNDADVKLCSKYRCNNNE